MHMCFICIKRITGIYTQLRMVHVSCNPLSKVVVDVRLPLYTRATIKLDSGKGVRCSNFNVGPGDSFPPGSQSAFHSTFCIWTLPMGRERQVDPDYGLIPDHGLIPDPRLAPDLRLIPEFVFQVFVNSFWAVPLAGRPIHALQLLCCYARQEL